MSDPSPVATERLCAWCRRPIRAAARREMHDVFPGSGGIARAWTIYTNQYGGTLDRRWLRVASIGGIRGADRQRAQWEAHYYPDIVPAMRGGIA